MRVTAALHCWPLRQARRNNLTTGRILTSVLPLGVGVGVGRSGLAPLESSSAGPFKPANVQILPPSRSPCKREALGDTRRCARGSGPERR